MTVLSFEDARRVVEEHAAKLSAPVTEWVGLQAASGRVLAEDVFADRDLPPFPRSTRDGYAVRSDDVAKLPATLDVIGEIKAGEQEEKIPTAVEPGQTVSIMTGAPVPSGADSVVMVEYTTRRGNRVEIARSTAPGENIVPCGAEAKRGSRLLGRGMRLNEAAIAVAASVGKSRLQVYARPRVAVLSTGDEIVDVETAPGPTQIRNSNSYSLAVQVSRAGGDPTLLPIAPDEPHRLKELIEEGLRFDLLLMTGGVSMGRYDLVEQVLAELHAEFFFTGAKIQPGKPVVFGRCENRHLWQHRPEVGYPESVGARTQYHAAQRTCSRTRSDGSGSGHAPANPFLQPRPVVDANDSRFAVCITLKTAPLPVLRTFNETSDDRILMHVVQLLCLFPLAPDIEVVKALQPHMPVN